MEFSVQNLYGLLFRSKLLSPDENKSMFARWQAEGNEHVASSAHFLRWLIANQYLTEYQAGLLGKGHADGFFLGQYKVLDRLGRGRMAGVYKAAHQLGQIVAIKVLPPSKAKNPAALARFQREVRLALKLKHPNVVRSFQMGESGGVYFLVMEHLDGETLEDVLARRKRLPPHEGVRVIHQALAGLQHIHEQRLVHRDLKPANLMLVPPRVAGEPDTTLKATVKILDIGLGRALFDETGQAAEDLQLTGEGVLLGTPDYLAPEQARDAHNIDIRADIYSLGCVLYHCLTGQPPFPDNSVLNQMIRHAKETPKPLRELNPAVPDGLQQVINWMLAKDPNQRYPTPERAAQAMQAFQVAGSEPPKRIEDAPQMRRYLTWLETGPNGGGKDEDAATSRQATTPVVGQPPPMPPTRGKHGGSHHRHASKKHKKHKHGSHAEKAAKKAAGGPVAAVPLRADQFDVELVAMPPGAVPGAAPVGKLGLGSLSRRDWTLLGIGAGGVIVAVLIGMMLAQVFN